MVDLSFHVNKKKIFKLYYILIMYKKKVIKQNKNDKNKIKKILKN